MKNRIPSYEQFVNENKLNEGSEDPRIKKEAISRLSDFFRVSPNALTKFNFDGKDNIKELTKALNSTSDIGTKAYYDVAIKLAKEELGIHESTEVNEGEYTEFEEFLNESNELIKAQGICKNTMFQVQKEVDKLFSDMVKKGLADSFTTRVEPWNTGYQLKTGFDITRLWRKKDRNEIPEEIASLTSKIAGAGSLYLQPGNFFDEYFEEGKGAKIEGHVFQLEDKQPYNVTYPKWDIANKNDIPKAGKEYLDIVKTQIAEFRKKLEL